MVLGDCVFAVYSTASKEEIYDVYQRAVYINTYLKMLNKLLDERNLPNIKAGIGLAADKNLAVKAGRKSSGINDFVWIGKAVTTASNLADLGNKEGICPIVMSGTFTLIILMLKRMKIQKLVEKIMITKTVHITMEILYLQNLMNGLSQV